MHGVLNHRKRRSGAGRDVSRPRVLLVSHAYSEPGLRRQIDAVARHCDIRLVAPSHAHALVFPDFRPNDDGSGRLVTYRRISLFGKQFFLLTATFDLVRYRPDIVHIDYDPWAAVFWQTRVITALFAPRARIVSGAKKNTYRQYPGVRGVIKRSLAGLGLIGVDRILAASEMTARMYQRQLGVDPERIVVATHVGVDTDRFAPGPNRRADSDRPLRVGYVGRYSAHKGVTDLVDAVELCRETGIDVQLELLGGGVLRDDLRRLARERPWLTVHDPVPSDEVAAFLRTLDVFALPARILPDHQEHDGHALLQALSSGLACVATRSGIVPEILGEDDAGLVIEPGSSTAMADALSLLAADSERRVGLQHRAREVAIARYGYDVVARGRETLYHETLAAARSRR